MNGVNDSLKPLGIITSLTGNFGLVRQLSRREITTRYRGSVLGFLWTLLNPLLMLAIYTFIFGHVFNARWGAASAAPLPASSIK